MGLLFASDRPWVEPKLIRDTFDSLPMPPGDREKIYTLNARRLLGLSIQPSP